MNLIEKLNQEGSSRSDDSDDGESRLRETNQMQRYSALRETEGPGSTVGRPGKKMSQMNLSNVSYVTNDLREQLRPKLFPTDGLAAAKATARRMRPQQIVVNLKKRGVDF